MEGERMSMNTDGKVLDAGDCPCGGSECSGAFGWLWKSSDLGHTNHRGKMWAVVCPKWDKTETAWDTVQGKFAERRADPPPPPGIEGDFNRFRKYDWDNIKQSKSDIAMNSKHESGTGADAGTNIDGGGA